MQKKKVIWVICGICLLLPVLLLILAGYWFVSSNPFFSKDVREARARASALDTAYPFTPVETALVSKGRLEDWVVVQRKLAAVEAAHRQVIEYPNDVSLEKMASDMVELSQNTGEMAAQLNGAAEVLDSAHMSPREYSWIGNQVLGALNAPAAEKKDGFKELIEKARNGGYEWGGGAPSQTDEQIATVLTLLEPHLADVRDSLKAFELLPPNMLESLLHPFGRWLS